MFKVTDQSALIAIVNAYNDKNWTQAYSLVLQSLQVFDPVTSSYGRHPDVDPAVYLWIEGAQKVNSKTGGFATYIREYTKRQWELRAGDTAQNFELQIQTTSDLIAQRFFATFLGDNLDKEGPQRLTPPSSNFNSATLTSSAGTVPSLETIAKIDAASAASVVFSEQYGLESSELRLNYTPWAGTVLFADLGLGSLYRDWVLTKDANNYKGEKGLYDLVAIAQVTVEKKQPSLSNVLTLIGDAATVIQ
jgi:hypothetical protein